MAKYQLDQDLNSSWYAEGGAVESGEELPESPELSTAAAL
jgi:hypothetical protein